MFSYSSLVALVLVAFGATSITAEDPIDLITANYQVTLNFQGSMIHLCDDAARAQINGYTLTAMNEIMQDYRDDIGSDLVFHKIETKGQAVSHRALSGGDDMEGEDRDLVAPPVPKYRFVPPTRPKLTCMLAVGCPYIIYIDGNCCCACRPVAGLGPDDGFRALRVLRGKKPKKPKVILADVEVELTQKLGFALSDDIAAKKFECLNGVTGVTARLIKRDD